MHGHDEVIPHLVLAQNPLLAERFVTHSLGRLMDPKVRNREQLLETLEAYLARGSVKEAAAALGLHRHTVLYRLEKAKVFSYRHSLPPRNISCSLGYC